MKLKNKDTIEKCVSKYAIMTLGIIILGYFLVLVKLYEVISLFLCFCTIISYKIYKHDKENKMDTSKNQLAIKIFDILDGKIVFRWKLIKTRMAIKYKMFEIKLRKNFSWAILFEAIALLIIIGVSSYLRYYDTFVHAALPLSDSYVTLAWMKYINGRQLFHDGIYPQGFHIYLATIFKFAAVDEIFILRYTGPLNVLFTAIGIYYVIRKLTSNGLGALAGAWIYGIYLVVFPNFPIERQAATNSQEFAFLFVFPAFYFFYKYITKQVKEYLIVGMACTAIVGLVHSLAYALVGVLIGILIFSALLTLKKSWKPVIHVCIASLITVGLSLLPLIIGNILGKAVHSSSAAYLVEQGKYTYTYTTLTSLDFIALVSLVLLSFFIVRKKATNEERFLALFTVMAGISVFVLYYAGGVLTQNTLIATRSGDLWGLMLPLCVGISISFIFKGVKKRWDVVFNLLGMIAIVLSLFIYKPQPILPYKMEHDENIEQYLRISQHFMPKTWLIVSQEEGYAVSLGNGYHMYLGDFLKQYDPKGEALTKVSHGIIDRNIPPNIFIFQEKKIFQVSKTNTIYEILAPQYERRKKEYKQLSEWIKTHKESGFSVKTFYENENIRVYQLEMPKEDMNLRKK